MKRILVTTLIIGILLLSACGAPTPTPAPPTSTQTPEMTGVAPIQTVAGDLVIVVDENGLSINKNKFDVGSTLDDYIKVLGDPSRVTELMNTIHTYDDAGIRLYQPPDTNKVISVGIDFTSANYQFSPKYTFRGVLTVGHLSVDSGLHLDSLRSIPNLIVEDSSLEVYKGTLGNIILMFDYRESRERLDSLAISFSEPSGESTKQREPEVEKGWIRLIIEDAGSIDYPTDFLELQSEEYIDKAKEALLDLSQIIILGKSDFTLQQVGLNELLPSALEEFRRVMLNTVYLNQGEEVFRANEKYIWSQEDLNHLENQLIDELLQEFATLKTKGLENKLIESVSIEVKEVNRLFTIVHTYKRQLNDNPVVLVKHYISQNYNKIHHLFFSYRVVDEEECRDIYEKILNSFRLG